MSEGWMPRLTPRVHAIPGVVSKPQKLTVPIFEEKLTESIIKLHTDLTDTLTDWLETKLSARLDEIVDARLTSHLTALRRDVRPPSPDRAHTSKTRRNDKPYSSEDYIRPRISINSRRNAFADKKKNGGITMIFGSKKTGKFTHSPRRSEEKVSVISGYSSALDVMTLPHTQSRFLTTMGTTVGAVGNVGSTAVGTAFSMGKSITGKATGLMSRVGFRSNNSKVNVPVVSEEEELSTYSPLENGGDEAPQDIPTDQIGREHSYALLRQEQDTYSFGETGTPRGDEKDPKVEESGTASVSRSLLSDENQDRKGRCRGESRVKPKRENLRGSEYHHLEWLNPASEEDPPDEKMAKSCAYRLVHSTAFTYTTGTAILANAISLGLQTDYMARNWTEEVPIEYDIFDSATAFYFLVEFLLRFHVLRGRFFDEDNFVANAFDLFCLISILFDTGCSWMAIFVWPTWRGGVNNAFMIVLRGLRLIRIMRFFRMLSVFPELRMLVVSLRHSIKALFWSVVMVFLLVFMTSVYLTQLVTNYKVRNVSKREELSELIRFYGTLDRSLLSLYEAISEGLHWGELVQPLEEHVGKWIAICFAIYMAFMIFAMLNVITGRLCECSIEVAKEDRKTTLLKEMVTVFKEFDEDCDGSVSREEFCAQMDNPKMLDFLKAVDLDEEAALVLFDVLKDENDGKLEAKEFVSGCARINGPAKATDIAKMSKEWEAHAEYVEDMLCDIFNQMMSGEPLLAGEDEGREDEGVSPDEDPPDDGVRLKLSHNTHTTKDSHGSYQ